MPDEAELCQGAHSLLDENHLKGLKADLYVLEGA